MPCRKSILFNDNLQVAVPDPNRTNLRGQGISAVEAVMRGCEVRFKPLVMTALTSFIGHLPMLYATGSGADIQKPLAVVVMGGLITSTLLTLIVLPTLYLLFAKRFSLRGTDLDLDRENEEKSPK